jgi:hypothetical protein
MASLIVPLEDSVRERMGHFGWVNWSYVAQEACAKRRIFEGFLKTRKLSKEDSEYCEKIDWHPVDWLPLKEEFIKSIIEAEKEEGIPINDLSELFE